MNRIILASLISLASIPAFATQIDYNGAPVNFSTDTTWTLDDLSTVVKSGSFIISNGATLTLLGAAGQSLEWFTSGSVDINGAIYAPGLNISLSATDSFSFFGSLVANSISIYSAGVASLNSDPELPTSGVIAASVTIGAGGSIVMPGQLAQAITINESHETVYAEISPIVLTAPTIIVGETQYFGSDSLGGVITLQGPTIGELTEVPLTGGAFYFLGALAPLVARRLRKKH